MGTVRESNHRDLAEIRELLVGVGESLDRAVEEVERCKGSCTVVRPSETQEQTRTPTNGGGRVLVTGATTVSSGGSALSLYPEDP